MASENVASGCLSYSKFPHWLLVLLLLSCCIPGISSPDNCVTQLPHLSLLSSFRDLRPFSHTSLLSAPKTFSAMPGSSFFRPSMKAVMSSTKTLSFEGGHTVTASPRASGGANAEEKTAPLRPRESGCDGLERFRNAPFKLYTPLVLKVPQSTRRIFLRGLTCVAQAHTTVRLTRSKTAAEHELDRHLVYFTCFVIKYAISISVSRAVRSSHPLPIYSIPLDTISFLSCRYLKRGQTLQRTKQGGQKRTCGFPSKRFSESGRTSSCRFFARTSRGISPFVSYGKSRGPSVWKPSQPTPMRALTALLPQLLIPPRVVFHALHLGVALRTLLRTFIPFLFTSLHEFSIFLQVFQHLQTRLHVGGFVIFCNKSTPPAVLVIIRLTIF